MLFVIYAALRAASVRVSGSCCQGVCELCLGIISYPQLRSQTRCACSHGFSQPRLCRVCYYSIPIFLYPWLTIHVSRRLTAVDKRRFKVRLFSV